VKTVEGGMTDAERAVQACLRRAGVYRLLGAAFAYPGAGRLETLGGLAEALAPTAAPGPGEALGRFAAAARDTDPAGAAGEHVFLFDRAARCPPYEGAWGDAPQLAGKSALLADVAGFYAAFGLAPAAARPDMEDHVAAECEFMSALAVKEGYALAEGHLEGREVTRRAEARFLADHLGRWAEAFAGALREATPLPYYRALADLLEAWVRAETEILGAEPERLTGRFGFDPIRDEETFTCPMAEPEEPAEGGPP
jgi:TorA maturation chaperone TorD